MSGQSWTYLNHLKNVLSCVNQWYHLPFRLHSNNWKTTSLTRCLVNTRKYSPRWNPSVGKTSSVFVNSSTCIPTSKSIHKMHVTIFHMGKHKRHFYNSSQLTPYHTNKEMQLQFKTSGRSNTNNHKSRTSSKHPTDCQIPQSEQRNQVYCDKEHNQTPKNYRLKLPVSSNTHTTASVKVTPTDNNTSQP